MVHVYRSVNRLPIYLWYMCMIGGDWVYVPAFAIILGNQNTRIKFSYQITFIA